MADTPSQQTIWATTLGVYHMIDVWDDQLFSIVTADPVHCP